MLGLIRCDTPGCDVLIERHILRCHGCERDYGVHPKRVGQRGHLPPPSPPVSSVRAKQAPKRGRGVPRPGQRRRHKTPNRRASR